MTEEPTRGSSPLTRGKRPGLAASHASIGLIPAHAGKTRTFMASRLRGRAHPRSRGENARSCGTGSSLIGSSPLTRGKLVRSAGTSRANRLIPAHAGKTRSPRVRVHSAGAHPRSRGENGDMDSEAALFAGSSPLTRGKPGISGLADAGKRLIPAHAGKTTPPHAATHSSTAHPRSRGENAASASASQSVAGSSPLTRGKPTCPTCGVTLAWLIPAHAGKTNPQPVCERAREAHPRSRGENGAPAGRLSPSSGSSPLTRGKPLVESTPNQRLGLIPAHAGKTPAGR